MRATAFAVPVLAAAALLSVSGGAPASAQGFEYPYCTSGGWSTDNTCRFYTLEQCMTFVQGVGGFCVPNPRANLQGAPRPRRRGMP